MRKRFTKIICASVAAISAFGLVFSAGCGNYKWNAVSEKDTTPVVEGTNGGFLVQTGDFVYFINGNARYTDNNNFGDVLKGSIQRIKKTDLESGNYSSTDTIVPSVVYSGQYSAGIYIYGDYIYYTTPSTQRDSSGNILNSTLDFRRTTLDGSVTDRSPIWQCDNNTVDYRYVELDGTVYILYAMNESLYGSSALNIHSINCSTGDNKVLAYNVGSYLFDTADPTNPTVYYTMKVPYFMGGTDTYGYNQLYRVRADVKESPREYDFSMVSNYDESSNPLYINYGDFVFDGIGTTQNQTEGRVTQFNYAYWENKQYDLTNAEYTYELKSYEDGTLYYTRAESTGSTGGNEYILKDGEIDSDGDGRVDSSWDAVSKNKEIKPFLYLTDTTTYKFVEIKGETYAISTGTNIMMGKLENGLVKHSYPISEDSSANILFIREEDTDIGKNLYMYYSLSGGNGLTFYRIAIDGSEGNYGDLPDEVEWNKTWTYKGVKILDLDACAAWYKPEFVGNTLVFASETFGMTSYNYVMACNLDNGKGKMLTNAQLHDLKEKYEKVTEKIEEYDKETNTDGSMAYENLSNALKYQWYTGDENYLDELIKAYVDISGKDKEYLYSERTAEIYHEYAKAEGDWADYKEDSKTVNGKTVYANSRDYYYSVLGRMTEGDANGLKNYYKSQYMQSYPQDTRTWWEKLSTGAKVGFILGMVAAGLVVLAGLAIGTLYVIKLIKNKKGGAINDSRINVDITDDRDVDVYGDNAQ